MSALEKSIAFIGLGVMGYPMAANLRKKIDREIVLVVADIDDATCQRLKDETSSHGPVEIVKSAYDAVQIADTLITVLPNDAAVKAVYMDPELGAIAGAAESSRHGGKLFIECGTISQATILEVSKQAKALPNLNFVDAPISGGPLGSQSGTLTFMVGSPPDLFPHIKSILVHMGKEESITHCGNVGAGTASKTINNYISLITVVAVSEAYNIANRMGLDLSMLTGIFNSSSAQCWVTSKNNPVPGIQPNVAASRNYTGGFKVELARKDLSLAVELAKLAGARTVLDKAALSVFDEVAADPRYAGRDARVVYKYLSENEF